MEVTAPSLHNIHPKKVLVSIIREHWFSKLVLFSVQQLLISVVPISLHWLQREHTQSKVWAAQMQTLHKSASCVSGSFRGTTGKRDGYANVRGPISQGRNVDPCTPNLLYTVASSMGAPRKQVPEWSGHLHSSCSAETPFCPLQLQRSSLYQWSPDTSKHCDTSFSAMEDPRACVQYQVVLWVYQLHQSRQEGHAEHSLQIQEVDKISRHHFTRVSLPCHPRHAASYQI